MHKTTLQSQGFRFIRRGNDFEWVHPAEIFPSDIDCTDMSDEDFQEEATQADFSKRGFYLPIIGESK